MKKVIVWLLVGGLLIAGLMLAGCSGPGEGDPLDEDAISIGIMQIIDHPALDAARQGFIDALGDEGFVEGENVAYNIKSAQGEFSTAISIAEGFAADNVDMILAIATPTAQAAAQVTSEIPIMFTAVTDPVDAGLVESLELPGGNITGTHDMNPIQDQLELILEIVPDAKTVGVIFNSAEDNSIVQVNLVKELAPGLGLSIKEAPVTSTGEVFTAAESLVGLADAIYIPTDNTVVAAIASVVQVAEENNIPIIAGEENTVTEGALATVGIDYYKLGYQTGQMAVKVLRGEADPATTPVQGQTEYNYVVNLTVAEKIGIELPPSLLERSVKVD